MENLIYLLAALLLVLVVRTALFQRVVVLEYQQAVLYKNGRFTRILEPGRHWVYRPTSVLRLVDARRLFETVPGQELISSDGITVKLTLVVVYEIADAARALNSVQNYREALYLVIQTELRDAIGSQTIEEILQKRNDFGASIAEQADARVGDFGLRVLSVDVKDIMLPGEVKKLFNQIVRAQKEGQAALEKARAETAALRNLANAAKMMEDHPSLMQLRALQQMGESTGNTLVLGLPADGVHVPHAAKQAATSEE